MKAQPNHKSPPVQAEPAIGIAESPYLLSEEAAVYLRFKSPQLFREWVWKYGVPHVKRGQRLLFRREVLDDFMENIRYASAKVRRRR